MDGELPWDEAGTPARCLLRIPLPIGNCLCGSILYLKEAFFMQRTGAFYDRTLYKSPFSRAYWVQAAREFKDLRVLVFAALMIAIRVMLKIPKIPLATDLNVSFTFVANAFGSMVYGPVVAVPTGIVSDFLGYLVANPDGGPYYPLFILTECAGSVLYALFLYRAEITAPRVFLAKFSVNFLVNVVLTVPVMRGYYAFRQMTAVYPLFDGLRIVKNLVMLPVEAVVLTLFLRAVVPAVKPLGCVASTVDRLKLTRRHYALLAALFLAGICATGGYMIYDYNSKSFSKDYTPQERFVKNNEMNAFVAREYPDQEEENIVTVIQSARSKAFDPEMTYELKVYRINWDQFRARKGSIIKVSGKEQVYSLYVVRGYSKSFADKDAADGTLTLIGSGTAVTNKHTGELLSIDIGWIKDTAEGENTP